MNNEQTKSHATTCPESLLTEYGATQDACLHYDNFSWQVGSVLIAGVFVFWGFVFGAVPNEDLWLPANILVWAIMTIWLLYTQHNRQIYLFKLHRIHEIEKVCGMLQHRRFKKWSNTEPKTYVLKGPPGHYLDDAIYAVVSLGGPVLAWAISKEYRSMFLIVFVIAIILWVHSMDRSAKNIISRLEKENG